jgi:hypothetical protein
MAARSSLSLRLPSTPPALWSARTPPATAVQREAAPSVPPEISGSAAHGWRGTSHIPETDLSWKETHRSRSRPSRAALYSLHLTPMRPTTRLELLIPLEDNNGVPFPNVAFADFEDSLISIAGGFTRHGDVEGAWKAPDGHVMRDRSRSYVVTVPEKLTDHAASSINRYVRRQFRQQAAFVEALSARAVAF